MKKAFTLVELLLVMAVMALIVTLATPSVGGLMKGSKLTQAGTEVAAQIDQARHAAIARNQNVEVRFYKYGTTSADASKVRAFQLLAISDTGSPTPLGKVRYLPLGTIMDCGPAISSLFDSAKRNCVTNPTYSVPGIGKNYSYFAFRFRPDGATDLSPSVGGTSQSWFLTLHNESDGDNLSKPPANFWTIQVDAINGGVTNYRP